MINYDPEQRTKTIIKSDDPVFGVAENDQIHNGLIFHNLVFLATRKNIYVTQWGAKKGEHQAKQPL
jgi:hypothetical protein